MNSSDPLSAGLAALDAGDDREARRLLGSAVRQNPEDVDAWWHLAAVMTDPAQKAHCLRQVLRLQPDHLAAGKLLRDAERRIASPTPSYGLPRPVLDASATNSMVNGTQIEESKQQRSWLGRIVWMFLAGVGILAALVIVSFVVAGGTLGRGSVNPTSQPVQVRIGVPSCATGEIDGTQLIFVNQSSQSIQLYRGEPEREDFLGSIAPGKELSIEATSVARVRYSVRTKEMALTEGAILEVPSNNSCRVPIIEP